VIRILRHVFSAAQAPASAISFDELQGLTYLQVKGSGIANTCPVIDGGSSNLKDIKPGNYKIQKLCLEPTSFTVKEESQFKGGDTDFVPTKLMTRLTYTLDEVRTPAAKCA
jgi:photosystem II oxygen-evolving enhancer protein 1